MHPPLSPETPDVLRLLLDEHVSPAIAEQLPAHRPELEVIALQDWEAGAFRNTPDAELLQTAKAQGLTLVTYDRRTITPLLKAWMEAGESHGGVVFVDERTIAPSDIGGLVRALAQLWDAQGSLDWTDRVVYLAR
jgi:hypothetical protein